MDFGYLRDDDKRRLAHEDEEQTNARPHLQKLSDMVVANVTVRDLNILLLLSVDTYPNRMTVKRLYEQYVGFTKWAPQREPA